ncbi:ABC transporter substrate-binding protein [Brachybacterium sp. DNPG3]
MLTASLSPAPTAALRSAGPIAAGPIAADRTARSGAPSGTHRRPLAPPRPMHGSAHAAARRRPRIAARPVTATCVSRAGSAFSASPFLRSGAGAGAGLRGVGPARRTLLTAGMVGSVAGSLLLAGCGPSARTAETSNEVSFTFWGPTFYQDFTAEMVDAFLAANSEITVDLQPSEWDGYWDRLATQVAGGTPPDVINMDGKYIAEYSGRGVLADLESLADLDLSGIAAADLDAGRVDGVLTGLSTGSNAWVIAANPTVFAAAGVDMPDDTTWTWDDFQAIAKAISDSGVATGVTGGGSYADLTIFLRQKGEDMWAEDAMGCTVESLTEWYQLYLDLQESGATLAADAAVEDASVALEQQAFSTGDAAMTWTWTNQLQSLRDAVGEDGAVMLRPPSLAGAATENGLFKKATMFWSISATSTRQDQAAQLVDFLVNDPGAQKIQLLNRGVPSDPAAVEAMGDALTATDQEVVAFLDAVTAEITGAPAVQPMGTADSQNTLTRMLDEVRFGTSTPAEAAQTTLDEINGMVES